MIKKYGKVCILEKGIRIENFEFKQNADCREILDWAKKRLEEELNNLTENINKEVK